MGDVTRLNLVPRLLAINVLIIFASLASADDDWTLFVRHSYDHVDVAAVDTSVRFVGSAAKHDETVDPTTHHDRIDFVYFKGKGVTLNDAKVVGESEENADIVVSPYPSDHRAVTFTLARQPQSEKLDANNCVNRSGESGRN